MFLPNNLKTRLFSRVCSIRHMPQLKLVFLATWMKQIASLLLRLESEDILVIILSFSSIERRYFQSILQNLCKALLSPSIRLFIVVHGEIEV